MPPLQRTKKNAKTNVVDFPRKRQQLKGTASTKQQRKEKRNLISNRDSVDSDERREPLATATTTNNTSTSDDNLTSNNALQNQMAMGGMYGSSPFGYGGYGMGGMMSPMMMMPGSPFSGLYQVLFGVQNVVFSLSQAIQVLGMNQQAIQQAFDSLVNMFDHAVATFHELRAIEAMQIEKETEEQKRRRRRLKAIRWAILMGGSWLVYKLIHRITTGKRRRRLANHNHTTTNNNNGLMSLFGGNPGYGGGYSNYGGYGSSYGSNMYGGYGHSPGAGGYGYQGY